MAVLLFPSVDASYWYPKTTITLAVVLGYLGLVRALRWRRYEEVHRKFAGRIHSLTPAEAQKITHLSSQWDMPALMTIALSFALFKTYAIPSISNLLLRTRQLGSKENVSRRYADTEILISTWVTCPISGKFEFDGPSANGEDFDPRCAIAIARTNWLHSKYDISNDDYLYTLCLFIFEPIDWIARYGWRELSELEKQAYYVFWVEVGRRMGIKDIPESLDDLKRWSMKYEEHYMVPAASNRAVAQFTIDELLCFAPEKYGIKNFLQRIVVCLLETRVRVAMMYEEQPWYLHLLTQGLTQAAAVCQRHCMPPRLAPSLFVKYDTPKSKDGSEPRMHQSRPWYKPRQSGFGALLEQFTVAAGLVREDNVASPRNKWRGYRLEELGPERFEHSGHEETMRIAAELQGCPVTGPWSLRPRPHQHSRSVSASRSSL
ncbi:hypothetical protein OE88DRAFT_1801631 [Heliocybe sulcata]|uniref:ER-bound oxygenase mpaB/mpaB'/Rubber oxygenase catalytic domain-containing protein n=1 Tax=Heliocybe sulcata TaxID=5364 RepID=A0A5C3N1Q8_9AGAM|nr:hypothetical protein OE88DRAFT_1801631 [Heliocybe sulcata]